MISKFRSIDSLLNRFDELSKCHDSFLSSFDTNFSDIKNPLRHVTRTENEQQKYTEKSGLGLNQNDDPFESIGVLEDFHRRIIKSQYLHRPPTYSSNGGSLIHRVPSKSSLITIESTSLPRISQITIKTNTSQPVVPTSNNNIIESKVNSTKIITPKVVSQNLPSPRRNARGRIRAFTMETVNRLSKPKIYNRLPDQKPPIKRIVPRPKPYENIKKEASKRSTLPSIPLPSMKRTKTTTIQSSSKKLKPEKQIPIQTSKINPVSSSFRPIIFVRSAPTIPFNFPMQLQQKLSHVDDLPKLITTTKISMIHIKT